MNNRTIKYFALFGIPGLALFVFMFLMNKFDFHFSQIGPIFSAIIVILFLVIVFVIVFTAIKTKTDTTTSVLHEYETFKKGLQSTFDNVRLIEQIANSNDKNKIGYLQNLYSETNLSWIEKDSISHAIQCIKEEKKVQNLYEFIKEKEWHKIDQMFKNVSKTDSILINIFKQLKYWRFINRRNHPDFQNVERALALGLTGQLSIDELKEVLSQILI